jgi:hypothetical protein
VSKEAYRVLPSSFEIPCSIFNIRFWLRLQAALGEILRETKTTCYAWALIPNHFHLLLRSGSIPISAIMRRLLKGYAPWFNRTHRRHGDLFQNRFKSILCQEDA